MNYFEEKMKRECDAEAKARAAHDAGLADRIAAALRTERAVQPPEPKLCTNGCGQLTTRVRWGRPVCESCVPIAKESPASSFTRGMVRK